MNNSLLGKRGHGFMQQSVRNVCSKFKVDSLNRFRTGARQVFTTQKLFPSQIPLTMKTTTSNSLKTDFLIKLPSLKFLLKSLTSNKSILKLHQGISLFFISFFCWNEINKISSREDMRKTRSSHLSLQLD